MEKYAFFLDIDGTLAKGGVIHPDNVKTITEAQKQGHFVFINTGRSYAYIPDFVFKSANYDGFLCGLAADIRLHDKQIFSKCISKETLNKLAELFLSMPGTVALFEGEDKVYYTTPWHDVENGQKIYNADEFYTKYPDAKITKFTCECINKDLFGTVLDELTLLDQGHYFELGIKGCNKAVGMIMVANEIGIPKERCVAIGDSINDEDMLRAAGIAVVTENGVERMKKIATFVTDDVRQAGVARAIERIINKK